MAKMMFTVTEVSTSPALIGVSKAADSANCDAKGAIEDRVRDTASVVDGERFAEGDAGEVGEALGFGRGVLHSFLDELVFVRRGVVDGEVD